MSNFKVCDTCYKKATTSGCLNCSTNKIKSAAFELDEFLERNKSNLSKYFIFINTLYFNVLKSVLKFNLDTILDIIRPTNMLNNNEICVIVDKKELDWGNINLTTYKGED